MDTKRPVKLKCDFLKIIDVLPCTAGEAAAVINSPRTKYRFKTRNNIYVSSHVNTCDIPLISTTNWQDKDSVIIDGTKIVIRDDPKFKGIKSYYTDYNILNLKNNEEKEIFLKLLEARKSGIPIKFNIDEHGKKSVEISCTDAEIVAFKKRVETFEQGRKNWEEKFKSLY